MKRIILSLCLFIFIRTEAQQINPVPDYVFSNKMSVGRNTVTDTAAYFSIGPRYGAVRGFMPPMVTDTATITTGKRNGLTIFSIQKNKYMYWDSVRVRWSDFAGSSGAYIFASDTSSMLSPYIRAAGNGLTKSGQSLLVDTAAIATRARVQKAVDSLGAVKGSGTVTSVSAGTGMSFTTITTTGSVAADTTVLSTRAWRRKGLDSLAALELSLSDTASMLTPYTRGSGTTNYLPKFTGSRTFGNSVAFDNGGTELLVNTTSDAGAYTLQVNGAQYLNGRLEATGNISSATNFRFNNADFSQVAIVDNGGAFGGGYNFTFSGTTPQHAATGSMSGYYYGSSNVNFYTNTTQAAGTTAPLRMRIKDDGEVLIGTTSDAGAYALQVNGTTYTLGLTMPGGGYSLVYGTSNANTRITGDNSGGVNTYIEMRTNGANRLRVQEDGEILLNNISDAGAYTLQVAGSIYNTTGGALAVSSGDVFIGGTSDAYADAGRKILSLNGTSNSLFSMRSGGTSMGFLYANGTTSFDIVSNGKPITFNTSSALSQERLRIHSNGGLKFVGQADPPQAEAGTVYYDTDDNKLKVYNGTTWVDLH